MSVASSLVPAASPAHAMSPGLIILLLAMLLALQAVTTDLYLPALPALTEGFGASMVQAQLTLTALLLAFGISQLVWGPLSDRFGRRPILLWGMSAYVLASIASTLAPTMEVLIFARIVQGAAMGAAVMCARAIVRDLHHPAEGARVMSKAQSGLGVIACMCAPLGGLLSDWFNWRAALLAVTVFGVVLLAVVARRFQETVTQKNPKALQPATFVPVSASVVRVEAERAEGGARDGGRQSAVESGQNLTHRPRSCPTRIACNGAVPLWICVQV